MKKIEKKLIELGYVLLAKHCWIKNKEKTKLSILLNDDLTAIQKYWVRPNQEIIDQEEINNIQKSYDILKDDIKILNKIKE